MEHARRGELQTALAISSLARTDRWPQVDQLLTQIAQRQIDPATLAEMMQAIGPSLFLRMKQQDTLSESAESALDKLAKAAATQAESPERLRAAIDNLDSPSTDARLAAARSLLGGGNAAIAELVAAVVSENPSSDRDEILRAIVQLGPGGIKALRQLALYASPPIRGRAVAALARIDARMHLSDLLTALHAADSTAEEAAAAAAQLQASAGDAPGVAPAIDYLLNDFQAIRDRARLIENDNQIAASWSVNGDRTGVTFVSAGVMAGAYRDVVDAGARLRRLGSLSMNVNSQVLSADMAYRIIIDPDWGDTEQVKAIRESYGTTASGTALSGAITEAIEADDHAAAIGLIRLIDSDASVLERSLLLQGNGGAPTALVQATASSDPQVRYEAALAVSRLAAGAPFAASAK